MCVFCCKPLRWNMMGKMQCSMLRFGRDRDHDRNTLRDMGGHACGVSDSPPQRNTIFPHASKRKQRKTPYL